MDLLERGGKKILSQKSSKTGKNSVFWTQHLILSNKLLKILISCTRLLQALGGETGTKYPITNWRVVGTW